MKKSYASIFTALGLLFTTGIQAQDFVYAPNQHVVDTVDGPNFSSFQIDLTTPTPEAITFGWETISNSLPASWSYSLCDLGGCYVGTPAGGEMREITLSESQNGLTGFFKYSMTLGTNYGHGVVEIYVFDKNDYSRGDTVSFDLLWDQSLGLTVTEVKPFTFSPNPVKDQLNLNIGSDAVTVAVYDMTGKELATEKFVANSTGKMDFSNYRPGIYFIRSTAPNGVVSTKRVVKQ